MATLMATSAGEINRPLQPAFLAYRLGADTSITGDGTIYTLVCDNEIFDQGSDFDGTSTFTSPIAGRYQFSIQLAITNTAAGHSDAYVILNTSNRSYKIRQINPRAVTLAANRTIGFPGSVITDMDAADTAILQLVVSGSTKTINLAVSTIANIFSGNLKY